MIMHELEKTTRFHEQEIQLVGQAVTIFDADKPPYTINLSSFNKDVITFGRNSKNDIVLSSSLVSREKHGEFVKVNDRWTIRDCKSTNGLICNDVYISSKDVMDGDFVRIDSGSNTIPQGVLFVFTSSADTNKWKSVPSRTSPDITIGRNEGCTITLPHVSVSNSHAKITYVNGHFYITDTGSTNGLSVNGKYITEKTLLHEKDVIVITNSKLIFTSNKIYYCCFRNGISVDANDIVITRGKGKKEFVTCNHVNLNIRPGELVAIIGGSGAGKSTVLNCMCGYLKPKEGSVYINGVDLYQSFESLKKIIGYVPQSDIVYDNLTVYDMLMYTAKLRLPADTSDEEREKAIFGALETVELVEKKNSYIRALSGGQKKRASIAVELLSDPNLLFLDGKGWVCSNYLKITGGQSFVSGDYKIQCSNGKFVTYTDKPANDVNIVLYDDLYKTSISDQQIWNFKPLYYYSDSGVIVYQITPAVNSRYSLDCDATNNELLHLWQSLNIEAQQWIVEVCPDGSIKLLNNATRYALTASANHNNSEVITYTVNNSNGQKFYLVSP